MVRTRTHDLALGLEDRPLCDGDLFIAPPPSLQSPSDQGQLAALTQQVQILVMLIRDQSLGRQLPRGQPTTTALPTATAPHSTHRSPPSRWSHHRRSVSPPPLCHGSRSHRSPTPEPRKSRRDSVRDKRPRTPISSRGASTKSSQKGSIEEATRHHTDRRLSKQDHELRQLARLQGGRELVHREPQPPLFPEYHGDVDPNMVQDAKH